MLGDDGVVFYLLDGDSTDIDLVQSTSTTAFGGADIITTGGGSDLVIGGRLGDSIDAGDGDNAVIGDSAIILADSVNAPQLPGLRRFRFPPGVRACLFGQNLRNEAVR